LLPESRRLLIAIDAIAFLSIFAAKLIPIATERPCPNDPLAHSIPECADQDGPAITILMYAMLRDVFRQNNPPAQEPHTPQDNNALLKDESIPIRPFGFLGTML